MPACPNCGNMIGSPSKMFTVIVEPNEGERGLTQRRVGMYSCEKCGTKFPTVISRQHYLVVAEEQMKQIQAEVKDLRKNNDNLQKRVETMDREYSEIQRTLERNKRDAETRVLEAKVEALEKHVAYLRKEKGELEAKAARLR